MNRDRKIKLSKYISKHLRHTPERIGLTLESGGWVLVKDLLKACNDHQMTITRDQLDDIVLTNDKQRFSFDTTGTKIRANQGHSVEVDLQLEPIAPPDILYHGTAESSVTAILKSGLLKMSRHHVHLSRDRDTAYKVGARHGKPAIFTVDTAAMDRNGFVFYRSNNNVWLVDHVPPQYLQLATTGH